MKAEGFSVSLDVLHGGPSETNKFQFFIYKIIGLGIKNLDPDPDCNWIPDWIRIRNDLKC